MKIGILTFHWGTNYGAILQAYALQTYLVKAGYEVFIIDYKPRRLQKSLIRCFYTYRFYLYPKRIKEYLKELKLRKFRANYMNLSKEYNSLDDLKANPPSYDVYICGSDQIWNPSFTTKGEVKATSSYFLDFGDEKIKRIAYAVSFGHDQLYEEAASIVKRYIPVFDAISVREYSGIKIVKELGYPNPVLLPDPTILLKPTDYTFFNEENSNIKNYAFVYMLRGEKRGIEKILNETRKHFVLKSECRIFNHLSVDEWVSSIRNAKFVVTNSFHGMVFSLIFHIPFVVILPSSIAKSMNDRFLTLLSIVGLEDRMIKSNNSDKIEQLISQEINWIPIDIKMSEMREKSRQFFKTFLD